MCKTADRQSGIPEDENKLLKNGEKNILTGNREDVRRTEPGSDVADRIELALDEADRAAAMPGRRLSAEEVFKRVKPFCSVQDLHCPVCGPNAT